MQAHQTITQNAENAMPVRIASEAIKLPGGRIGYYGCAQTGLVLAIVHNQRPASGDVVYVRLSKNPVIDKKSGALIVETM